MGRVEQILSYYAGSPAGVLKNLRELMMHGRLGGTGRMLVLPIDQGFEHGPGLAFSVQPDAYNPINHFERAIKLGLSAYAAPLGSLELGATTYAGCIPTILKLNSNNRLVQGGSAPYPAWTASVEDALRLGCTAVGMTIYPGSDASPDMFSEVGEVIAEAKAYGLPSIVWAYPRGGDLSTEGATALDVVAYGAHMAALLGAHIIKVKLPSDHIAYDAAAYKHVEKSTMADRVRHIVQCAFDGRRIVLFSGGETKNDEAVLQDVKAIAQGGGFGSMMARNLFQRSLSEAQNLTNSIMDVYQS